MTQLNSFDKLNDILAPYGARISTANKCLQPKSDGYIGGAFIKAVKPTNKPIYDFSIVSKKDGKSFANIYSDIYRKIPSEVLQSISEYYIETSRSIYL